jgi:hypothetical protein
MISGSWKSGIATRSKTKRDTMIVVRDLRSSPTDQDRPSRFRSAACTAVPTCGIIAFITVAVARELAFQVGLQGAIEQRVDGPSQAGSPSLQKSKGG